MEAKDKLLYWVLMYLIEPEIGLPLEKPINYVFSTHGGISGDPGWSVERTPVENGNFVYLVSVETEHSPVSFSEGKYDEVAFLKALRITLEIIADRFPERRREVLVVLNKYGLVD